MKLDKGRNDVMTGRPSVMVFDESSSMNYNQTD